MFHNKYLQYICAHARTHTHTQWFIIDSFIQHVLFFYACTLIGQGFICTYIFMAMYSFLPPYMR
jgi:hypothetical protein